MTKYEFLNELKNYLNEKLSPSEVSYHIDYYRNYIDGELANGRSETEILEELGEPRIVGKTIIDAAKLGGIHGNASSGSGYTSSSDHDTSSGNGYRSNGSSYTSSGGSMFENNYEHNTSDFNNRGCFFDTSTVWGKIKLIALIIVVLAIIVTIVKFAVNLLIYILPALIVIGLISAIFRKR